MAWIIDTQFNSSLFALDAVAPLTVGGGNKMLSLAGIGVVYNNSFNLLNQELTADIFTQQFSNNTYAGGLVARHTPAGSFYFTAMLWQSSTVHTIALLYYNDVLDTFTFLATANSVAAGPVNTLYTHTFRVNGSNLYANLIKQSTQQIIVEVAAIHSVISVAGNPGVQSYIAQSQGSVQHFMDNFIVRSL